MVIELLDGYLMPPEKQQNILLVQYYLKYSMCNFSGLPPSLPHYYGYKILTWPLYYTLYGHHIKHTRLTALKST